MSTLLERLLFGGRQNSTGEPVERPVAPNPDLAYKYQWNAPTVQPLVRIGIFDGMVSYEDDQPLITPDGGIHLETPTPGSGQWAQLYRAGRLYGR